MTHLAIYNSPPSQATAQQQRLFKTRRANRAWTMSERALIATGRECAPWQAPSADQLAEVIFDNVDRLGSRGRNVLATVFDAVVRSDS